MIRGDIPVPPIASTLDFALTAFGKGTATFEMDPQQIHYNPIGSVHGGAIATLLDSACGCAVQTLLPRGTVYTTLDLQTRFLRPVTVGTGRVTAVANVINRGSRTALVEARLTDAKGRLLAHATSTCMIIEAPPAG